MHNIFESINYVAQQTIMISGFVLYMMLIIEYINVRSKGKWSEPLKKSGIAQIAVSNTIGIIPGCVGIFTIVSLYTHNIIKFPALLSGSIATMGDEAFVMLSMIPSTAIKIGFSLLIISFIVGIFFHLFFKNKFSFTSQESHLNHHEHDECLCFNKKSIFNQIKNISFHRALLISILILIVLFQLFNGHSHGHEECTNSSHSEHIWENLFFVIASIFSIAIVTTVPEHFLVEHLWGHILKKHFLRIFLWTLISLTLITLAMNYWNIENWVQNNTYFMLFLALVVGIIPISGPHILFISLFASGSIPFSILLANTIVQEGHGGLPLMADAKKSFIIMKLIKIIIALIIGAIGLFYNW
jgi:hypothetical protein